MEKPTPDGCVVVDMMIPALDKPARREFSFAELKHWRKTSWGVEFVYNKDGDGGRALVTIPWSNIRELIVCCNSEEYISSLIEWRHQGGPPNLVASPKLLSEASKHDHDHMAPGSAR